MDTGCYTADTYENCLHQLDRVGRFLGGDRATFKAFQRLKEPPKSILDVGCGGGLFTMRLASQYPEAKVVGIDIAPEALDFANRQLKNVYPHLNNVEFIVPQSSHLQYPENSFDIVTSTLMCHHLSDAEIP